MAGPKDAELTFYIIENSDPSLLRRSACIFPDLFWQVYMMPYIEPAVCTDIFERRVQLPGILHAYLNTISLVVHGCRKTQCSILRKLNATTQQLEA